MGRHIALSFLFWAGFGHLVVAVVEILVLGRFEWTASVPSAIGSGIGLTIAMRVVSPRQRKS